MVEEHRVQSLADIVVATEREREVAHATAYVRTAKVLLYPGTGAYEVNAVCSVLIDTRCHGKYVGVKDYFVWLKAGLLCQQFKGTATDLDLALVCSGLPLLVKSHYHNHCTKTARLNGALKEESLALLEGDGVHHGTSLNALETCTYHVPVRRIDHHRHACNVRLTGKHIKECHHLGPGIQKAVVHIDIYQLSTVLNLLAGDIQSLGILLLVYQAQELARTCHIAALAHINKIHAAVHYQCLEPREPQFGRPCHRAARQHSVGHRREEGNVLIGSSTTTAHNVHKPLVNVLAHNGSHLLGCLVIAAKLVWQAGIGVDTHIAGGNLAQAFEERFHLPCAEGAVQTHRQDVAVGHRCHEGLYCLPREYTSLLVGNGKGEHHRHLAPCCCASLIGSIERRLGIERVEDCLAQQGIHPTLYERNHLLAIGFGKHIKGYIPLSRVLNIGAYGASAACGTHRTHHETWFRGRRVGIGQSARHRGRLAVYLDTQVPATILGLRNAVGVECGGLDDVGTGSQVAAVNLAYHVGACEHQYIIVAFQQPVVPGKQ